MENNTNMFIGWDTEIEEDGKEYVVLPEGDYNFVVANFVKGTFNGTAKIPQCDAAILTLQVNLENGCAVTVQDTLPMYKPMEWKLSEFFRCIGQKKHGEKLRPNWGSVIGSQGRAHFKPRSGKTDPAKQYNNVDKYIDYDQKFFGVQQTASSNQAWVNHAEQQVPQQMNFNQNSQYGGFNMSNR